ncbi:MAG: DUF2752 domain-containing protein [Prevotella sp.]|nr:DUF2752 domain-containing protein [Prevotella sp.]
MSPAKKTTFILGTLGVITVLALLYVFNPAETALAPKCVFKAITGWSCSGCGMQRFLHAFMHGRFLEAIHYNYMLVVFLPYIILFSIEQLLLKGETKRRWKRVLEGPVMITAICIMVPIWCVVRNILHV